MLIRHLPRHLPSLLEIGKQPFNALRRHFRPQDFTLKELPGPEWIEPCPPLPSALLQDLGQWCGQPLTETLPPACFFFWMAPILQKLRNLLPHTAPLLWTSLQLTPGVPIQSQAPLELHGRLMRYEDNLRGQALISLHLELHALDGDDTALLIDLEAQQSIPEKPQEDEDRDTMLMPALPPQIPEDVHEIAEISYSRKDELILTHLLGQTSNFASTLFHGDCSPFGVFLKTSTLLGRYFGLNLERLQKLEVDFLRPIALPCTLALSLKDNTYWLGAGSGAPAMQLGHFITKEEAQHA